MSSSLGNVYSGEREQKIYLAAPLFTEAEREFNLKLYQYLIDNEYSVFLPQKECAEAQGKAIYQICLSGLRSASVVVAVLDGADADSGTCWECGYAVSQGIPVIATRTDWRKSGDTGGFNAMLYYSAAQIVEASENFLGEILAAISAVSR